jgi:hypothetical protein
MNETVYFIIDYIIQLYKIYIFIIHTCFKKIKNVLYSIITKIYFIQPILKYINHFYYI